VRPAIDKLARGIFHAEHDFPNRMGRAPPPWDPLPEETKEVYRAKAARVVLYYQKMLFSGFNRMISDVIEERLEAERQKRKAERKRRGVIRWRP
jgi:hypothetical protein